MRFCLKIFTLSLFLLMATSSLWAEDAAPISVEAAQPAVLSADAIYKKYASAIYQVQSISTQTNKRNSIGSGFQISKDGFLVTNYHVISDVVNYPQLFHLRTLQPNGHEESAQVIRFDVIHDVAIIKIKPSQDLVLPLGSSELNKGTEIFSLGNPLDLGLTVLSGLSNGYMEKALYKKVLTTLALNPGMSGGPSVDGKGDVVGVNVATAGDALSFLVPVEFLKNLWQKVIDSNYQPPKNLVEDVQQQLISQESEYFSKLLSQPWEKQKFGAFIVPAVIANEFSCWGQAQKDNESWLDRPYLSCALKDDIYISSTMFAHTVLFNYSWIKSQDYNPWRFYDLTNSYVDKGYQFDLNGISNEDAFNFKCRSDVVTIARRPFWVSSCARRLRSLNKLYDVNVRMASLGEADQMLVVELTLGSLTKDTALKFINKFYKEMQ